jgi:hypothetical protein
MAMHLNSRLLIAGALYILDYSVLRSIVRSTGVEFSGVLEYRVLWSTLAQTTLVLEY